MPDRSLLTLSTVVGLLGFLVVTAVATGQAERQKAAPRKAELVSLIGDRRHLVDNLDNAVETLRADVAAAQRRANRANSADAAEAAAADHLALLAGTVPLRGPGLVVSLSPSDREPPSAEEAGAYEIHDSDLQLVVNELWAADADAVAVNDSRLVATTPIRAAGGTIVVNFRPLSPPYRVSAIGADRAAFAASAIARRFERWTELFGLGFSVSERPSVSVPGYTGRVAISTATPVGAT
ncbi:MAG TPA: DUF881 domain-containing protein [Acidimicrobiales bacterium]|nr:DUF881 domain-containing protein [Acidimicrobiales bacterium]